MPSAARPAPPFLAPPFSLPVRSSSRRRALSSLTGRESREGAVASTGSRQKPGPGGGGSRVSQLLLAALDSRLRGDFYHQLVAGGGRRTTESLCGASVHPQATGKFVDSPPIHLHVQETQRIPPAFSQYLKNEPLGLLCLLGQSGNPWLVELASDTEGLFFRNGWKEFVMDHSIEERHILTFCYYRRSHFSVVVFDEMCIEKPSAFHAQPSIDVVATTESEEEDKQISVAPQDQENNGTKKKRTREIDANSSTLRKRSNEASVGYKSASLKSTEDSVSSNHMSEESISSKHSSKSLAMLRFSKDVYIRGKTIVEVQRQPAVISQRPPIIPCEFVREYLPNTNKKLTLWDPQGKAWEVSYVYCSQRRAGAFSGGWGKFSIGNHL